MRYDTHLVFALLCGLLFLLEFNIEYPIIFILFVLVSGLLPDIDTPNSKIGKKFPILSKIFNLFFGHRGLVHSLAIPLVLLILFLILKMPYIAWGIFIGNVSHLIGDIFTKEGVMPFYPILKFRIRGFIKTGSFFESLLFVVIFAADIYIILKFF